ncbi:MAG: putative 4-hydroxybenzoate polyprenyltransferase [Fimbriimonadales bacterium]|nr:putative 4-hydroxybenzoate polyprenyltransferase [Fimbriimonadales bacterium]
MPPVMSASFGRKVRIFLEAIKFEHTIFALPFAMLSLLYAAEGIPEARVVGWILVAMVASRTAAMAFNRIADRDIDALNPRTQGRALPAGLLTPRQMASATTVAALVFLYAAWQLNGICFALAPVALAIVLGYSYSKRFTPLAHYWLGLSLGIAPSAVWLAVRGTLEPAPLWLSLGVALWVAGFDILYSLQDEAFDRAHGLRSLPQTLGAARAILVSRLSHALCIGAFLMGGRLLGAGGWFFAGVAFAAAMLAYEQSLVKPNDLSRIDVAFFTLNGYVSIGLFLFAVLDKMF